MNPQPPGEVPPPQKVTERLSGVPELGHGRIELGCDGPLEVCSGVLGFLG